MPPVWGKWLEMDGMGAENLSRGVEKIPEPWDEEKSERKKEAPSRGPWDERENAAACGGMEPGGGGEPGADGAGVGENGGGELVAGERAGGSAGILPAGAGVREVSGF
jgi:hypothetical protein